MSTHVLREDRWSGSSSYRTSTVVRGSAQKQVFSGSHTVMYTISARTRDLSLPPVWLQVLPRTQWASIEAEQYTNRSLLTPANRHMSSPPLPSTTATGILLAPFLVRVSRVRILEAMFHVITCNYVC